MPNSDRQPLLPTHSQSTQGKPHVNHSSSSRLSTTRISFPSSTSSALSPEDGEDPFPLPVGSPSGQRGDYRGALTATKTGEGKKPGLPKLSRECLWSEIKCYGSYMLPPLLVFGVLVVGVSLFAVGWKMGWFK